MANNDDSHSVASSHASGISHFGGQKGEIFDTYRANRAEIGSTMRELRANHPVVLALDPEDDDQLNTRDDWDTQRAVVIAQLNALVNQARQNWNPAIAVNAPFLESIAKWIDRQHATLSNAVSYASRRRSTEMVG